MSHDRRELDGVAFVAKLLPQNRVNAVLQRSGVLVHSSVGRKIGLVGEMVFTES